MPVPKNPVVAATETILKDVAGMYLDAYQGRDESRYQRISVWIRLMGDKPFISIAPEDKAYRKAADGE